MSHTFKSALKQRTKEWNSQQKKGFSDAEDMLTKKGSYLEDILVIYQDELEMLQSAVPMSHSEGAKSRAARIVEGVGATDLNAAVADASHYFDLFQNAQQEIRHLSDEVTFLRKEHAKGVAKVTEDFQRSLARNNERHQQQMRIVLQEAEIDKSRVGSLEAELNSIKSVNEARNAEELMNATNQIESMERELATLRRDLANEQRRSAELEREVASSRRRVAQATEFMNSVDTVTQHVVHFLIKHKESHQRLVDTLLADETALQGEGSRSAPVQSLAASTSDSLMTKISGTTATERLSQLLQLWEDTAEAQHLELSVAARCANEQHFKNEKQTQAKLMESFGHCELLMQRIQQMDVQHAEMKEFVQQERDRALDMRDKAVVLVRAMEQAKEKRAAMATVGVQTVRSEGLR